MYLLLLSKIGLYWALADNRHIFVLYANIFQENQSHSNDRMSAYLLIQIVLECK